MYGFRYHVVSLAAVFMAIGFGILLGSSLGTDAVRSQQSLLLNRLSQKYHQSQLERAQLTKRLHEVTTTLDHETLVMERLARRYITNRLANKHVAIVNLNGTDVSFLRDVLHTTGALITEDIVFRPGVSMSQTVAAMAGTNGIRSDAGRSYLWNWQAQEIAEEMFHPAQGPWLAKLQETGLVTIHGDFQIPPEAVIIIGGIDNGENERIVTLDLPLINRIAAWHVPVVVVERSSVPKSGMDMYQRTGLSTINEIDTPAGQVALVDILSGTQKGYLGEKEG